MPFFASSSRVLDSAGSHCTASGRVSSRSTVCLFAARLHLRLLAPAICVVLILAVGMGAVGLAGTAGLAAAPALAAPSEAPSEAPSDSSNDAHLTASAVPERQVGEVEDFHILDFDTQQNTTVRAVLRHVGEHCLVYTPQATPLPSMVPSAIASEFDTNVYPSVTANLGGPPDPGIDGDPRITILLYSFGNQSVAGYFYPGDIDPEGTGAPDSNRREMIYLNLDRVRFDPVVAGSVAAHEFAHLVHYYRDFMLAPPHQRAPEARWIDEGLSMHAELVSGYSAYAWAELSAFASQPNKNLTSWAGGYLNDYGASYLFVTYLAERMGQAFVPVLVQEPANGVGGVNAALSTWGAFETFDTIFDDWVVANYLDGRLPGFRPWGYALLNIAAQAAPVAGPLPRVGTVAGLQNFAASYVELDLQPPEAEIRVVIDGEDGAPLRAALVSWNESGEGGVVVTHVPLNPMTAGGWAEAPLDFERHALALWARGAEGAPDTFWVRYSLAADPPRDVQFLDVDSDHLFFPYIDRLVAEGAIGGREVPAGSGLLYFQSGDPVLRAQFAKMAMEVAGLHTEEIENLDSPTFSDVHPQYEGGEPLPYPFDYIEEAAEAGIAGGYTDGRFGPWDPMTRIQLVRMILRTADAVGAPLPAYLGAEEVFADLTSGSPLYTEVMTAYANGILNGSPGLDGRLYFRPWDTASRGHVSKMTANLLGLIR
jgi:hypothetical protein